MPLRRILILIPVLWLAAPSSARADEADDFIQAQMKMFHLHGISVALIRNGKIIKAQGYGVGKVFQPAGLSIVPTNTKKPIANKARGYDGRHNTNDAADWVALRPSGAFLSTVLDLAKWDAVLYTDRVLTDAERRQMYTPTRLNDGTTAAYGFGWHVESRNGRRFGSDCERTRTDVSAGSRGEAVNRSPTPESGCPCE
jgi:CubicO group peptidase (beta-lactamase class C family)